VRCKKCAMQREVVAKCLKAERWHCNGCGSSASCELIPSAVHAASECFGYLNVANCSLAQIGASTFRAFCSHCMGGSVLLKNVQPGRRAEASCALCFSKIAVQIEQVPVNNIIGGTSVKGKKRSKNSQKSHQPRNAPRNAKIVIENNGACEHFKKSFRLLRFPCCGKAFPCPLCHALSGCPSTSRLATRQICGFCGHESPANDKPCPSCGKKTNGKGGSGGHWNAGRGQRDASSLSSKDKRKNKGMSRTGVKKTASKKSQRVGAKGKRAREAAAAKRGK